MSSRRRFAPAAANVALAACFLLFASAHLRSFARHPRPSGLLMVGIEALFAFFFLTRAPSDRTAFSPAAWVSTLGGTFLPLFVRPIEASHDVVAGQIIQAIGFSFTAFGLLSLNRSFGLLPAHRDGIKTTGAYRWVRHPLYAAYAVVAAGYLVSNFTARNVTIVAIAYGCQLMRILNEERLLSQYPGYLDYRTRTRWRLLPYVF